MPEDLLQPHSQHKHSFITFDLIQKFCRQLGWFLHLVDNMVVQIVGDMVGHLGRNDWIKFRGGESADSTI